MADFQTLLDEALKPDDSISPQQDQGDTYPPIKWGWPETSQQSSSSNHNRFGALLEEAAAPSQYGPDISEAPHKTTNPVASLGQGMIDVLAGGAQGIAPYAGEEGKLAPPEEQAFFSEVGYPRDQQKYVAARDPRTGHYAVFERTPEMEESRLTTLGRLLPWGTAEAKSAGIGAARELSPSQNLYQDFQQTRVPANIPAVGQGKVSGLAAQALTAVPLASERVRHGFAQSAEAAANRAEQYAGQYGIAETPEQAGRTIESGIQQFGQGKAPAGMSAADIIASPVRESGFAAKANALYDRMYGLLPSEAQFQVDNTLSALRGLATKFPTNPEVGLAAGANPRFERMAGALEPHTTEIPATLSSLVDQYGNPFIAQAAQTVTSGGSLTFDELKNLRSLVGQKLGDFQLVSDVPRAEWKQLYAGISDDMRAAAQATSPEALNAFERANRFYQAGMKRVDQLEPILGKASNEGMFSAINSAAQTGAGANAGLLRSLQRSMPADEWQNVGAAVIRKMGQPSAGGKDILQETTFSPTAWATNWNKLSDAAKDTLFGADEAGSNRSNLEALSRVMQAQKNVGKLANTSHSAEVGFGMAGLATALMHTYHNFHDIIGNPTPHLLTAAAAIGGPRIIAGILMSPRLTNWLYNSGPTILGAPTTQAGVQRALAGLDFATRGSPYLQSLGTPFRDILSQAADVDASRQYETQPGQVLESIP